MPGDILEDEDARGMLPLLREAEIKVKDLQRKGYLMEDILRLIADGRPLPAQNQPYTFIAPFGTVRRCPLCGCLVAAKHLCAGVIR